ncbi:MAG: acyl-CoA thioesterase [Holosporales bacterium]
MNLLLRLILLLLTVRSRSRLGLFDESELVFHVLPTDLDLNMHMTNSRYLSLMDLGRIDLMFRTGVGRQALKRRWGVALGASTIRYRRSLTLGQRFVLKTRVVGWDEKWVIMEQKIEREGELIAHALMKGVFVARGKSVPTREIFASIGVDTDPQMLTSAMVSWAQLEEAMKAGEGEES